MKRIGVVVLALAALVAGGCGGSDEDVAALKQRAKDLEGRVAQLEEANAQLKEDFQTLDWQYSAMGPKVDALAETRVGTREAMEEIAREVVREQLAAAETPRNRAARLKGARGGRVLTIEGERLIVVPDGALFDVGGIVLPPGGLDAAEDPPAPDRKE